MEELNILTLDQVEKINKLLGKNTDESGIASVFSRLAQLATYVDTVETSLGQTGDAANATGTAHAKLAYIKNAIATGLSAVKSFQSGVTAGGTVSETFGGQTMNYVDVTITAVNTAKTEVTTRFIYSGASSTYPTGYKFVNATTLRLYTNNTIGAVQWEVIEYV